MNSPQPASERATDPSLSPTEPPNSSISSGSFVDTGNAHPDTHLDKVPKAEVNPEHIAALPTTVEAPALAEGDSERPTEPDLEDLGWSKDPNVPVPLMYGMKNEELWILVRRFNQSIYHVRSIPPPPGKMDLNVSSEEEFFPDKLRSTLERLYLTWAIGIMAALKHVARIRTWNERNRTAGFALAYFLSWALNFLMPLFLATLIALIVHPPTRRTLFPPAPLALHSTKSGTKQKPQAGYLGSGDSLTGAAEAYKGMAAEQEASNFVNGFTSIALGSATGQGSPSATESPTSPASNITALDANSKEKGKEGEVGKMLPDPTVVVGHATKAQAVSNGDGATADKTKKPVEAAMWDAAGPVMHALNIASDIYERFANAFSPTPPFAQNTARVRIAAVIVPVLLISIFVNETLLYKSITFGIGVGMFGQPLFDRIDPERFIALLNNPKWPEMLDIRNTLLLGVPTNAQLTITLLRIGEANKAPLPPPPPAGEIQPPDTPTLEEAPPDEELDADHDEKAAETMKDDTSKPKKSSKVVSAIKGATKGVVRSALDADKIKATAGSEHSKTRLGVVGSKSEARQSDGPTSFAARHHGKKGTLMLSASATVPLISFVRDLDSRNPLVDMKPVFSIPIDHIAEIRKIGGFGWKGKMLIGWSLGAEVADGFEILDNTGRLERVTAIPRRDEVFNRLIALSSKQHWESL
ncbi:hypothetical protein PQX77_009841 [Marasmius sp. AFHP31]|nr:hypothetical protein PQX77_009841 [Marasmius sp. AFHP31]